jgi:hypothetical protein
MSAAALALLSTFVTAAAQELHAQEFRTQELQEPDRLVVHEVDVTCPIGGQSFKAPIISAYAMRAVRLDLKPIGALVAPNPLPVCPDNGFVVYKKAFTGDELAAIKDIVLGDDYRRLRAGHTDYYMAAYVKDRVGADDFDLGQTYLQASWEAERDRHHLVDQYRAHAVEKLDAFVTRDPDRSERWWTAVLLAAEAERMLGRFDAVEARLKGLRLEEVEASLGQTGAALVKAIDQIRLHALSRNAAPELFSDAVGQRS